MRMILLSALTAVSVGLIAMPSMAAPASGLRRRSGNGCDLAAERSGVRGTPLLQRQVLPDPAHLPVTGAICRAIRISRCSW